MSKPLTVPIFNNYTLYTLVPPSSGLVLAYILRLLDGIIPAENEALFTQRMTEAFKFAYGARSHLGDHRFVDTTQVCSSIEPVSNKISLLCIVILQSMTLARPPPPPPL